MKRAVIKTRLQCYFCFKVVSSKIPYDTVIRALIVCPECIELGKIIVPEQDNGDGAQFFDDIIKEN